MNTFAALADKTRKEIVELLCLHGEMTATEISQNFEVSKPAISQHLNVLKEVELVQVKKDAQRRLYSINPEGLKEIEDWAKEMCSFWENKLNALEKFLNKKRRKNEQKN